ncbi:MAG: hypothetical protein RIQ87_117 [Chloroflexota bacterium]
MLVVVLALAALLGAFVVERLLARGIATGKLTRPELHMSIEIAQPLDAVWAYASNIERQPEWMHEMKRVEMLTPPPVAPGSRGRATVRIFGISTTDDVVITRFEPPHTFAIRHEGRFVGEGLLEFSTLGPTRTRIDWMEYLRPPLLPNLGGYIQRPILRSIFRADLANLKEILEG